ISSMGNPVLDGARAKIERAIHHLQQLDIAVNKLWASESERISTYPPSYKMEGQHLIIFRARSAPVDPSLPLIVGDCIHNVRSALDHLVFQLAILNHSTVESASKTSFPVCLTHAEFKNATRNKIAPFISGVALAEIEKLQPYSTGDGKQDILWALSQLDIIDKHRLLIVTKSKVRPTRFTITNPSGEEATCYLPPHDWKPSEAGTELIRFDFSKSVLPPGKVKMKVETAMTVQIEETELSCDGMIVQAALNDCIQHAVNIIDVFGKLFFSE
ncbi:MAG TPA: hypothetical protein VJW96_06605, partial [Terriglobales bacterium]|nr:hypothetical protein [Terriglobales bacterium]